MRTRSVRATARPAAPVRPWSAGLLIAAALFAASALPARAVEVQRVISPGGIEAWLVESDLIPVISVEIAFDGGIETDPVGQEGRAHLAASLLTEGAGPYQAEAFQDLLTDNAISLGFEAGSDAVYGSLKVVTAKADLGFDLLRLALTEPRFDEAAVARVRAGVLADIQRRVADPEWMARRVFYGEAFAGHPYGRPSRGTAATLGALAAADLRAFMAERVARDGLVIGVTGDIGAEELALRLDRVFGALPAAQAPAPVPDIVPAQAGRTVLVERAGPQSVLLMTQPWIGRGHPDYYAARVLNHIVGGGGFGSRLTGEVRETRGLTYGIVSYGIDFEHADLWQVRSQVSNAHVAEAQAVIREIIADVAENGVTRAEFDETIPFLTGSFPLQFTATDRVAAILMVMQRRDLGIDFIDRRNAYLQAVTFEDVNRVAAELFRPDALFTVVVGDPPAGGVAADAVIPAAALAAEELARI